MTDKIIAYSAMFCCVV